MDTKDPIKADIKHTDAEIMAWDVIDGYHLNDFPNREARRRAAKKGGIFKPERFTNWKRYNGERNNVQTWHKT